MDIDEKRLCSDWLAEFPLLKRHQGGRKLLRVYDPVVFGIELRKIYSKWYRPEFIAMNLLSKWKSFNVNTEILTKKSLQYHIEYDEHAQQYGEAARIMRVCFPILSSEEVTEQMIVDLYRQECERAKAGNPLDIWASLVEILKYYGRAEECAEEKQRLIAYARAMPPAGLSRTGGLEGYVREVETEVDAPIGVLLARRAEHLARGGLGKLPGTVCSPRLRVHEGHEKG